MTDEEVERGYNNRAAVPDYADWFARWAKTSAEVRSGLGAQVDVRYGPNPKQTMDIFVPAGKAHGTFVFIHGGYWRALDKSEHGFVAPVFVDAGYAVAVVNYDLCPDVTIDTIVDECRHAVAWIGRDGAAHGLAPSRLVVGGHSAGGHLAAMLHVTDWNAIGVAPPAIAGAVSISGVHDLTPMLQFSYNADLRLTQADALRLSPIQYRPTTAAPVLVVAGAQETSEFLRQARLLWDAWPQHRPRGARDLLVVPDRHHFSVVADYGDPHSDLTRQTLALFHP